MEIMVDYEVCIRQYEKLIMLFEDEAETMKRAVGDEVFEQYSRIISNEVEQTREMLRTINYFMQD